jgi:UPF0755 protein
MSTITRLSKWSFLLLIPATAGICAWQSWTWWSWAVSPPALSADEEEQAVQIQIPPGTPAQQIGEDLEAAGLIRSSTAWKLWARWLNTTKADGGFQAGTYTLSPAQPMQTIANTIWNGEVKTLSFTIPEGWNLKQMAQYFESEKFFTAEEFIAASRQIPQAEYPWLPTGLPHLEGFLYPDTYQLPADAITAEDVIKQMLRRFEQAALPLYQNSDRQNQLSLREWVTLASIVEKETVVTSEAGTIAGVFTRRLEEGMTLGADPTVEYGLGVTQTPDQPLTLSQVNTPNPYNTYINAGLPPTPIASPGLTALKATLAPEKTEFLYFVARYDGTHVFSRTLAEHEAAQEKIRQEREQNSERESEQNSSN